MKNKKFHEDFLGQTQLHAAIKKQIQREAVEIVKGTFWGKPKTFTVFTSSR